MNNLDKRFSYRIPVSDFDGNFIKFMYVELGDHFSTKKYVNGRPQQCTGKIDSGKRDIYEGDIVEVNGDADMVFTVEYCDECAGFHAFDNNHYHEEYLGEHGWDEQLSEEPYGCLACGGDGCDFATNSFDYTIVGNIYENKELLNGEGDV